MRYLILFTILLLWFGCTGQPDQPVREQNATTICEILVTKNGTVRSLVTLQDIQIDAARMIILGKWSLSDWEYDPIPVDSVLYDKYFYRVVRTGSGYDTVSCRGLSVRQHKNISGVLRAYDRVKMPITFANLSEVKTDIATSDFYHLIARDNIDGSLKENLKRWGKGELRSSKQRLIRMELSDTKIDSIRSDSVSWKFDFQKVRNERNLDNITLQQINNNVNIPTKLKEYAVDSVLSLSGINLQSTVVDLWLDDRINNKVHQVILNKLGLDETWLKRPE